MYDMSCLHMLNFFEFIKTFRQSLLKENNCCNGVWFFFTHMCSFKKNNHISNARYSENINFMSKST